ncbi:hypothetical protein HDU67_002202 [Dinochytrium kinnereticum]|nr:hypothetical protein HDU67_002202 [Dinochytrium kinnereticum]
MVRRPASSNPERKLYDPSQPRQKPSNLAAVEQPSPVFAPRILSSASSSKTETSGLQFVEFNVENAHKTDDGIEGESGKRFNASGKPSSSSKSPRLATRPEEPKVKGMISLSTGNGRSTKLQQPVIEELDLETLDMRDGKNVKLLYNTICKMEELIKHKNMGTSLVISDVHDRMKLASYHKCLILSHPTFTQTHDLENRMWKVCFHARIEQLRRSGFDASATNEDREALRAALDIIKEFYSDLLKGMKNAKEKTVSSPRWAKCVGYLGDLERYRVMLGEVGKGKDWREVKEVYEFAAFLAPGNGLYYYQLATISAMEYNFIAAFYDFARCLNARAPFLNAKDTILLLFVSARKYLESKKKPSLDLHFLRVYEILYTRISVDNFKLHMKSLHNSLLGRSRLPRPPKCHVHAAVLTVSLLTTLFGGVGDIFEEASESDREIRGLAAQFAAGVLQGILIDVAFSGGEVLECEGVVGLRVFLGWFRTACGKGWMMSRYFEPHYSLWQAFERFSRQLHSSIYPTTPTFEPDQHLSSPCLLFAEDWILRGFLPLQELYDRNKFNEEVGKSGSLEEIYQERVKLFPACGGLEERSERGKVLIRELGEVFKCAPFMEVDKESGEVSYIGGLKNPEYEVGRTVPRNDDQHPTHNLSSAPTHALTTTSPLCNGPIRRIDDDENEDDHAVSMIVKPEEHDDDDEDEEIEFSQMMIVRNPMNGDDDDTQESLLSPSDEAGLLLRELKLRKHELSKQIHSRGGGGQSGGFDDHGHRRTVSQNVPAALLDGVAGLKEEKVALKLDKSTSQLMFDTNCYVGDLDGVRSIIESGWSVVVPLVIITELDGLKSAEGSLGHSATLASSYLDPMFKPSSKSKPSNVTLITAQNSVLPYLTVRTEEWGPGVRGVDDVLVRCAKGWKGAVLVSEDVNLRLKARGAGVLTGGMDEVCLVAIGRKGPGRRWTGGGKQRRERVASGPAAGGGECG